MIALAIWDKTNEVITKPIKYRDELKGLKLNNKKPNKMIFPQKEVDRIGIHKVRSYVAFDGLITTIEGSLIYDGRKKDNVRIKFD